MPRIFKILCETCVVQQFFEPYRITKKLDGLCRILCLLVVSCFLSCVVDERKQDEKESIEIDSTRLVVIYGKVQNFDHDELDLQIGVNNLGTGAPQFYDKLHTDGSFSISFESYVPTDVWLRYKTNFLVLTHPGDSIYVEFDGKYNNRSDILESVKFRGDSDIANQEASLFQKMFFSGNFYPDGEKKQEAMKNYDLSDYLIYLDSLKHQGNTLYRNFVGSVNPQKEVKIWARTFLDGDFYNSLSTYPKAHQSLNGFYGPNRNVPDDYFDALLENLPMSESMFISGHALSTYINNFHHNYAIPKILNEESNKKFRTSNGGISVPSKTMDSLSVYGLIKHTPDSLLRQMVLSELFWQQLDIGNVGIIDKYWEVAESHIQSSFFRDPILKKYGLIKNRINNPKINAVTEVMESGRFTSNEIMDSIVDSNKGKIIYLDVWATWCGPCLVELPRSEKLKSEMDPKDVSFVYMCIDSEKKLWKAKLDELNLSGQNYFLNKSQSIEIRKQFDIQGIPYYMLIDQNGIVREKGSHLRPDNVKDKIYGLLKEYKISPRVEERRVFQ